MPEGAVLDLASVRPEGASSVYAGRVSGILGRARVAPETFLDRDGGVDVVVPIDLREILLCFAQGYFGFVVNILADRHGENARTVEGAFFDIFRFPAGNPIVHDVAAAIEETLLERDLIRQGSAQGRT